MKETIFIFLILWLVPHFVLTRAHSEAEQEADIEERQTCFVPVLPGVPCPISSPSSTPVTASTTQFTTTQSQPPSTAIQSSTSTQTPSSTSTPTPSSTSTPISSFTSSSTTSVTTATTSISPTEKDEPDNVSIRNSDPFYRTPAAEQLRCSSSVSNCTNCGYVDWLKIFNKTLSPSIPALEYLHNTNEKSCFRSCNATSSCVLYTFNKVNGTCKIHSEVNFEDVQNDTDWSAYMRISPRFTFLGEWILSKNSIPRGSPLHSSQQSNFFNCTISCALQKTCVFAVFELSNRKCTLYTKEASKTLGLKGNLISIQHSSSLRDDNLWRFRYIGATYQLQTPSSQYTTDSWESCIEDCSSSDPCQLATTTGTSDSSVDCYLYNFYQNRWYLDQPQPKATNSFYKLIRKNNTLNRKYPHFIKISTSSNPFETSFSSLANCHRRSRSSFISSWYTYNSTSGMCSLFDENSVKLEKIRNSSEYDMATFSKSIPTSYLPYYAFNSFWVSNVTTSGDIDGGQLTGNGCLGRCLDLENCSGVAIQWPEGNCSLYTDSSMNKIRSDRNSSGIDEGVQGIQIFAKFGDPRFLQDGSQYRCLTKPLVTWDEINQVLQFDGIDDARKELPLGNNGPLVPHGSGFEGQGNDTAGQQSDTRLLREKPVPDLRFGSGIELIELVPLVSTIEIESAAVGGPVGLVVGTAVAAVVVVGAILINAFTCWFKTCEKPEPETCERNCQTRSIDRFWDAVSRAISCTCDNQPEVRKLGRLETDEHEEENVEQLQENCRGKHIRDICRICCQVGYQPEENPVCSCSGSGGDPEWNPDPAKCIASDPCTSGEATYGGIQMVKIPVKNCNGHLYYGAVLNTRKRIPFYTVYSYNVINKNYDNPDIDRLSNWKAYPCKEEVNGEAIQSRQLKNEEYVAYNKDARSRGGQWDKGHFAPNADIRYLRDAVRATFLFVNAAPQDSYSNQEPWRLLESNLRFMFREDVTINGGPQMRQGYVITGVCLDDDDTSGIPGCFWKLACTRTDAGEVTVAGFYHLNELSLTSAQRLARTREVFQIRDQRNMGVNLGAFEIAEVWREASTFFGDSNDVNSMRECYRAPSINFPGNMRADEDLSLYNFWNQKLFYEGFNDTLGKNDEDQSTASVSGSPPSCGKKVVGYVTGWSDVKFMQEAASYLTHVIFAFVQMTSNGGLHVGSADPENSKDVSVDAKKSYLRLYEIKAAKQKSGGRLRTIFAVGGWANSQYYSNVARDSGLTQNFIKSALEILDYFDMDGVDIDWEYPVTGGANEGGKEDRDNYLNFLRSLRSSLVEHQRSRGRSTEYSLTIAGAAGSWVLEDGFDLPQIAEIVDWINVMTYDYYGAWDSKWGAYTGPHAPLYFAAPQGYSGKTNVDYTLKYYSCRIKNPDKLVMGLGFYGRFWNNSGSPVGEDPVWRKAVANGAGKFDGGFEPWRNIAKNYLKNPSYSRAFHFGTQTPYLETSAGFLMGYEDPRSIHEKVKYAAAKDFGGVMIWAVDLDDEENTMLRTASSETLCSGGSDGIPGEYKCPPIQEQRWWTLLDDEKKAGMCGKAAPLYKGYYPVCDPEDPGYACCSSSGFCGSGEKFCKCDGCVDYYENPEKILDEPVQPSGPVRWHTMDKFEPGPQCGYNGHLLENGDYAICNPDDDNGYCCSAAGYCGKSGEFCECEGCVNFRDNPDFSYPEKTWIDSGPNAGRCGDSVQVNGKKATCNPMSNEYYCCSASGYCGNGAEYCDCDGCVNYKS